MLVGDRGLVLQLPHEYVDQVRILDHDGHLLKHVLKSNVGLLQAGQRTKKEEKNLYTVNTL